MCYSLFVHADKNVKALLPATKEFAAQASLSNFVSLLSLLSSLWLLPHLC